MCHKTNNPLFSFFTAFLWPGQFHAPTRLLFLHLDGFWLPKLCAQDILHLDNVFCIISQSPRLHCHWSAQTGLSVHLMPQIMRPRSDRESAGHSDDDDGVMNEFTSEISRLRRKGSHADLELEWSVLSWETGSQGEPINQRIIVGVVIFKRGDKWLGTFTRCPLIIRAHCVSGELMILDTVQ